MAAYADWLTYRDIYTAGREPYIPNSEFSYWINKASGYIDLLTFERLKDAETLEEHKNAIILCACELAEYYYQTEDNIGKSGQSAGGYSVTYVQGGDIEIVRRYLLNTRLLYRGL